MARIVWSKTVSEGAKKAADIGLVTIMSKPSGRQSRPGLVLSFGGRHSTRDSCMLFVLRDTSHCVGSITLETARGAPQ